MTLGERISIRRKEKGLTQEALSEKMGVSPQAVSKWECDQTCPDIQALPKLAEILGCTVDELLTGNDRKSRSVVLVPEGERKDPKDVVLRITVDEDDGTKVKINLPMQLIEAGINLGVTGDIGNKVDLSKVCELVRQGLVGEIVTVDDGDGTRIRIFVE